MITQIHIRFIKMKSHCRCSSKLTEEQVEYIIDNTVKVLQDYVD